MSNGAVDGFLSAMDMHMDTATARRALVRDDPRLDLERVACPVFLLWGARDNQITTEDAFEYARRLRAPLRMIADCGHLLIGERLTRAPRRSRPRVRSTNCHSSSKRSASSAASALIPIRSVA